MGINRQASGIKTVRPMPDDQRPMTNRHHTGNSVAVSSRGIRIWEENRASERPDR
jgi:hypothetical protein